MYIIPEEVKEALAVELEEPEIHLPVVIQERDVAGLSNPLEDMRPYDYFASTLHYMIPSLKIDLKTHLLGYDDTYTVGGIALIYVDDTYSLHANLCLMINIILMLVLSLRIPIILIMFYIPMLI
ncbi:hypothetical protein VPH35_110905 [Triticum aestivum]